DVGELGVAVGIVAADVAERGRAEQRVADRVRQYVGIRVPGETLVVRDLDAADHQLAAGDEGMHVEALADPHARFLICVSPGRPRRWRDPPGRSPSGSRGCR